MRFDVVVVVWILNRENRPTPNHLVVGPFRRATPLSSLGSPTDRALTLTLRKDNTLMA